MTKPFQTMGLEDFYKQVVRTFDTMSEENPHSSRTLELMSRALVSVSRQYEPLSAFLLLMMLGIISSPVVTIHHIDYYGVGCDDLHVTPHLRTTLTAPSR